MRCRGPVQEQILAKRIDVYAIDAGRIAREVGLAGRINIVLQTCFFAISGVLPREEAIARIKEAIAKTYGRRGAEVVERNQAAVDRALEGLHRIEVPDRVTATRELPPPVPAHAPEFVRAVTAEMMAGRGDDLPVSALPVDGTYPSGTTAYEKRNISELVAVWDPDLCIQCGNCSFVCPHSVIRSRYYDPSRLEGAPDGFRSAPLEAPGLPDSRYTLQVYVEDCTGCGLCVEACPAVAPGDPVRKAINLGQREPLVAAERDNIAFFETLPASDRSRVDFGTVRGTQFLEPLFEFSGACAGCGETPYLKLLSQLFGDRLMVANATGCSSIYGGNLPTTPWTTDADGRGPAWSNSLFEDNAEFGLGFRLAADGHTELARRRLAELRDAVGRRARGRHPGGPAAAGVGAARAARAGGGADAAARRAGRPRRGRPAQRRRSPGPAQRVDRRRRRLGLRHRVRRARPRAGQRAQRQRAGARHRGLLQHRRADVQGDAARRRRQVRRRRQDHAEEGPRPAGDRLRQRLRRAGRHGRRSPADARGVPRGRGLRRAVAGASPTATASRTASRCARGSTSVWIVGGDGWAYDIGYGGLDHVLASGRNVNILVLDTEVYSDTGGQMSKSTPHGAVAKFAAAGKHQAKKDLGQLAMTYGNVYVGRVAMGANDAHTVRTFLEAESYDGPSLLIAYSPCIAHGYDLRNGIDQQYARGRQSATGR